MYVHVERALGPLEQELQAVSFWCGYWDLNTGSLKEQYILLVIELSLQPTCIQFKCNIIDYIVT